MSSSTSSIRPGMGRSIAGTKSATQTKRAQMADRGTLELIATHLGLAMRPLRDDISDLDHFKQFMYTLGWEVDDLPPAYTALATDVNAVVSAVRGLGDAPSV